MEIFILAIKNIKATFSNKLNLVYLSTLENSLNKLSLSFNNNYSESFKIFSSFFPLKIATLLEKIYSDEYKKSDTLFFLKTESNNKSSIEIVRKNIFDEFNKLIYKNSDFSYFMTLEEENRFKDLEKKFLNLQLIAEQEGFHILLDDFDAAKRNYKTLQKVKRGESILKSEKDELNAFLEKIYEAFSCSTSLELPDKNSMGKLLFDGIILTNTGHFFNKNHNLKECPTTTLKITAEFDATEAIQPLINIIRHNIKTVEKAKNSYTPKP